VITNQYINVSSVECLKYSVFFYQHLQTFQQWLLHIHGCSLHTFEKYMKHLFLEWCSDSEKWKACSCIMWNYYMIVCFERGIKIISLGLANTNLHYLLKFPFHDFLFFWKATSIYFLQCLVCGKAVSMHTLFNKFVTLEGKFCFQLREEKSFKI
jgi:hypothetical protein